MGYWWVNHSQTGKQEVQGGFLWSPKRDKAGGRRQGYANMELAEPGDVVFSFIDAVISYVGLVEAPAATMPKPREFGRAGDEWASEGWMLPVTFQSVPTPFKPAEHLSVLGGLLPEKYFPIRKENGYGVQSMYLAAISDELAEALLALAGLAGQVRVTSASVASEAEALVDVHQIESSENLKPTEKEQLIKARLGQGVFRNRVFKLHPVCKVTGVSDLRLLRASHIKPWRECTNDERLDGANGIMLSPHIDALFDRGLLSFEDDGRMLVHPSLAPEVLNRWFIPTDLRLSPFDASQWKYLAWHRQQWRRAAR